MELNRTGGPPIFESNGQLFVRKNLENPNMTRWENIQEYWAEGSNTKKRTTSRRGTHKVYRDKLPMMRKAIEKKRKEKRIYSLK